MEYRAAELWLVGGDEAPEPGALLDRAYRALGRPDRLHLVPAADIARVIARVTGRD